LILMIAIVALALNLRPAMAGIGPLLDLIQGGTAIGSTGAGLLTTLPVLLMGLCALAVHSLRRILGQDRGIAVGALLIALACLARLWAGDAGSASAAAMVATAAVAGGGVAIVQALAPTVIKQAFGANTDRAMGLYTTGIMAGAAIAAASAAGLADLFGWTGALAVWSLPAALAAILWTVVRRGEVKAAGPQVAAPVVRTRFWRSPRAWLLLVFFGLGTSAYTLVLAWLPPFYVGLGESRSIAGLMLGGLSLMEVVGGLTVSAMIRKFPDRRPLLLGALTLTLVGLMGLIFAPVTLAVPVVFVLGAGIGSLFPLTLILTMDHIDDPAKAGNLAAFVQGGGYIIASLAPLAAGWIRGRFADMTSAWVLMAAGVAVLMMLAWRFSPNSYGLIEGRASSLKSKAVQGEF